MICVSLACLYIFFIFIVAEIAYWSINFQVAKVKNKENKKDKRMKKKKHQKSIKYHQVNCTMGTESERKRWTGQENPSTERRLWLSNNFFDLRERRKK